MRDLTYYDVTPLLARLDAVERQDAKIVLVGGQAVKFWAERYATRGDGAKDGATVDCFLRLESGTATRCRTDALAGAGADAGAAADSLLRAMRKLGGAGKRRKVDVSSRKNDHLTRRGR